MLHVKSARQVVGVMKHLQRTMHNPRTHAVDGRILCEMPLRFTDHIDLDGN